MPLLSDEECHEIWERIVSANEHQVGGSHYRDAAKEGQQHWDRMWELYREAWFVGNITKYVERYRSKDGLKDLKKAAHYLQKLIELEEADAQKPKPEFKPEYALEDDNHDAE